MHNILVVDDDNKIVEGMSLILRDNFSDSLTVFTANNGLQALTAMQSIPISILVADIKMPIMNGMELLNFIKTNNLNVTVIMLSGYDDYSLIREALKTGAYDYLLKPVNINNLVAVITQIINFLPNIEPKHEFNMPEIKVTENNLHSNFFDMDVQEKLAKKEMLRLLHQALDDLLKSQHKEMFEKVHRFFEAIMPEDFTEAEIRQLLMQFMYDLMEREPKYIPIIASTKLTEYDIMSTIKNLPTLSQLKKSFCDINMYYIDYIIAKNAKSEERLVEQAKDYISQHLQENLHLSDVARCFFLHPNYFSSIFKAQTGVTFRDYLRIIRINKAKELMADNNQKLSAIATKVGYQDASHFNRAFKEVTGYSPSQYRRMQ